MLSDHTRFQDWSAQSQGIHIGVAATGVILTGINGVPTAIEIQKGNVQDKKHIREMLKLVSKVIPKDRC